MVIVVDVNPWVVVVTFIDYRPCRYGLTERERGRERERDRDTETKSVCERGGEGVERECQKGKGK